MLITSWKCGAPPSNRRKTAGKTAVELAEKTVGRPLAKPSENRPETAGKSPVFG